MTEIKNISNQARQAYEPVQVRVTKITAQGILCQSGEVGKATELQLYTGSAY